MMKTDKDNTMQQIDSKYTFWQLLSEYNIEIPIIQRDYAQGRPFDNETAIRNELLECFYNALVTKTCLAFDFVYGTVEDDILYPLDGQQRLTTFYLLHWYLAEKEGKIDEVRNALIKFSYTTRISSRDFCEMLVSLDYKPKAGESVSAFIKNENKYFRTWDYDPTIKAMLVMLDAIHEKFYKCEPCFDLLIENENPIISFNYLTMEHYALTDDLYIKMNARGKMLSTFENFKAKFIQHLRKNDFPVSYFESNIDGKWVDLLWDYRSSENTIDGQFMNLFCYFTEMIFLNFEEQQECESPFRNSDIRKLVDYYDSEKKVQLLYELLDLWENKKEAEEYLEGIMDKFRINGKVRLFDGKPDIFSDVVLGNAVTVTNKILLFSIMNRLIICGKETDHNAMVDYVRIVRNFLANNRFFSSAKCSFMPDFRFGRNGIPYTQFISGCLAEADDPYSVISEKYHYEVVGVNSEIYKQESIKANLILNKPELKGLIHGLEDMEVFRGSIFNVLDYAEEYRKEELADDLERLFTYDNSEQILPALLSVADYGIKLGSSFLGDRYFYGNKEHWYEILTYQGGSKYKHTIVELIRQYQDSEAEYIDDALKEIVDRNLANMDKNDWRYCIVKYPSTICDSIEIKNKNIVFAFEEHPQTTILHRMNGRTLNAAHVVPEYIEAAIQLRSKCLENVAGHNSDDSGSLKLNRAYTSDGIRFITITFNSEGSLSIDNFDEKDRPLIDQAIKKYKRRYSGKDKVERIVLLATIIDKEYANKYER